MDETVLIALGGNAILRHKEEGTAEEQFENVRITCHHLAEMVGEGYRIAVTHGNGPQVGDILLAYELAKGTLPPAERTPFQRNPYPCRDNPDQDAGRRE
jgi:carbamate kinase